MRSQVRLEPIGGYELSFPIKQEENPKTSLPDKAISIEDQAKLQDFLVTHKSARSIGLDTSRNVQATGL